MIHQGSRTCRALSRDRSRPRRIARGLSAAATTVAVLAGCTAPQPQTGPSAAAYDVLRLPGQAVNVPSPFLYRGGIGYVQASYVYDTLMWKDVDGKEIPWLATSHATDGAGLVHTYTLRETTWADGKPFTAADVVFTFTYLEAHRAAIVPNVVTVPPKGLVKDVEAVDARTVRFTLTRPDWTFSQFTGAGGIFIIPQHIWAGESDPAVVTSVEKLIGTGPYRLKAMDVTANTYRYEARDDFWGGKPAVKTIDVVSTGDPLAALLTGAVDQAGGVGPGTGLRPEAVAPFRAKPEFTVVDAPLGETVTALYFNLGRGGPLADPAFRRAVARAIDRRQMVAKAFGGTGQVGNPGLIPVGHPLHVDVPQYPFDRNAADAAFDAAGYRRPDPQGPRLDKDGKKLSFTLLTSQAQPKDTVDLVVADLAGVGIEARVETVDLPTFGQRRMSGSTELSINTFGGVATDEQPDGMGKVYGSASRSLQSAQGYSSPVFDSLLAKQRTELTPEARARIAADMQRTVAEDLPILPLVYPPLITICRTGAAPTWRYTPGGVGGLVPSVNNKVVFIGRSR